MFGNIGNLHYLCPHQYAIAKNLGTKIFGTMENPFKFGTMVDGEYFTDRTKELEYVKLVLA